jgi:hypothetical protein
MNDVTSRLTELGEALYEATRADLKRSTAPARKRRRLMGLGAAAVLIPATAVAASGLLSPDDVAKSLPAGTLALLGTTSTCEVVVDQVEYRCVLDEPPSPEPPGTPAPIRPDDPYRASSDSPEEPDPNGWLGAAEPTVDSTNHVNGGCRSLDAAGMTWQCFIGEAAVEQGIISRQFLGERVRGPGVG